MSGGSLVVVCCESDKSLLGFHWKSAVSPLGVRCESTVSLLGVHLESAGSSLNGLSKRALQMSSSHELSK